MPRSICLLFICSLLLSGCAHLQVKPKSEAWQAYRRQNLDFISNGRVSLRQDGKGAHVNYSWENYSALLSKIELLTPIGTTLGSWCKDSLGTVITDSSGKNYSGSDTDSLSAELFGYQLPLDYLALWFNGYYAPELPHEIKEDTLLQNGWQIKRTQTPERHPKKLFLTKQQLILQIIADDYTGQSRTNLTNPVCSRQHAALLL